MRSWMSRRFATMLPVAVLGSALLSACGGGGEPVVNDTPPVPPITEPARAENTGDAGIYLLAGDASIDNGVLLVDASGRFVLYHSLFTPGGSDVAEDAVLGNLAITGNMWTSAGAIFLHTASRASGVLNTSANLSAVRTAVPADGWDVTITNAPATAIGTRLQFNRAVGGADGYAAAPFRVEGSYNAGAVTIDAGTGRVRGSLAINCGIDGYASVTDPNVNVARMRVFISGVGCAPSGIPGGPAEFLGYYFVPPTNRPTTAWVFYGQVGDRPWFFELKPFV